MSSIKKNKKGGESHVIIINFYVDKYKEKLVIYSQ